MPLGAFAANRYHRAKLIAQIFAIITEINHQGTTVLLVDQNATQALKRAHRAYVLETGRVAKSAPAADLLDDPDVQAAYLDGHRAGARRARSPSTAPTHRLIHTVA